MKGNLKVLPVKKLPDDSSVGKKKPLDTRLPGATESGGFKPFLMVITAPVRSGKSNLLVNLIFNKNFGYRNYFDEIMYISPTIANDDTGRAIMEDDKIIKITEGLDQLDLILESIVEIQRAKEKEDRGHTLLILDDCLGLIKTIGNSYFASLCSRYRHYKLSIVVTTQNFRSVPVTCRYNATAYIIFKTNNRKELKKMTEELDGNFPFLEIYNKATDARYDFLYLNQETIKAYKNFDELLYEKD